MQPIRPSTCAARSPASQAHRKNDVAFRRHAPAPSLPRTRPRPSTPAHQVTPVRASLACAPAKLTRPVLVCGILGLLLHDPAIDAASEICEGLSLLQHRGQDACGIVTCGPKGRFFQCKANGMVRDVFDANALSRLIGGMGVGHGMFFVCFWQSRELMR